MGKQEGLGHYARSHSLLSAWRQLCEKEPFHAICLIREEEMATLPTVSFPWILSSLTLSSFLSERLTQYTPSHLFVDHPNWSSSHYTQIKSCFSIQVWVLGCFPLQEPFADLLLFPFPFPPFPLPTSTPYIYGEQYTLIRREISSQRPYSPWKGRQISSLLVALSGSDPGKCLHPILCQLSLPFFSHLSISILMGTALLRGETREIVQNYRYIEDSSQLATEIKNHDLVLTLGGVLTEETLCLGTPCCCVEWKYLAPFVKKKERAGWIFSLGSHSQIEKSLPSLLHNPTLLQERTERNWQQIDGKGNLRLIQHLISKHI